ncbi:MAG TPA: sulfatase-like hydrolase/transferase, partial [Kofleriaceae bacterium]|nr:sulfatase-like hydrolase/transferase [Kofleriaceae bacterium]
GAVEAMLSTTSIACDAGSLAVVAALGAIGATAAAAILGLALRALCVGPIARWAADLRAGGTRRVLAVWHAAMLLAGALGFAAASFVVTARVHAAYRELAAGTVAAVMTCLLTPLAIAALAAAHAAHRRWARSIAALPGGLDGGRAWIAGAALATALIALPIEIVGRAIPTMNRGPVITAALVVGLALALRLAGPARSRAVHALALALALAMLAGAGAIGRAERARLIAVERGAASKLVARAIWRLADRDGDGYAAAWAGGADCDDSDPGRSPGRLDVAGNGVDENCTGADAPVRRNPRAAAAMPPPDSTAERSFDAAPGSSSAHASGPSPTALASISARASEPPAPARPDPTAEHPSGHASRPPATARPDPSGEHPSDHASSPPPNLILISVDALRADHLGAWGYARPTSPALDRFAAGATRFAWAITSSPATKHALPSLLTGRHASSNDTGPGAPSIAEILRDAGWDTHAVMCCQHIRSPYDLRGFTSVDTSADDVRLRRAGHANADAMAGAMIEWLRHAATRPGDRPVFLWAHFYDPHDPYAAPPGSPPLDAGDLARYDAEVAFVDRHIGRVLDAIDRLGLAPTTVVAITSDHGEEFDEHGLRFHAHSLYNQVVRIPLLIRAPSCPHGRPARATGQVIDAPVSLVDIAPTLLELAGVAAPEGIHGHSLAPAVCDGAPPAHPVLVELVRERGKRDAVAMVDDRWKVIWDREANAWQLFARSDPDDRDDRAARDPAALATMRSRLLDLLDRELAVAPPGPGQQAATTAP